MKLSRDIQSLSVFKRDSAKFLKQIKKTGQPLVLTVNGKAAAVVLDPDAYHRSVTQSDRQDAIESIRRGMADVEAGRVRPIEEFFDEFFAKYAVEDKR